MPLPFVYSYCPTYRCRFRRGGGGRGGRGEEGCTENQGVEEGVGAWEIVVVSRYVPQITHWIALAAIKWAAYGR